MWALRLRRLGEQMQGTAPSPARERLSEEAWTVLKFALSHYLECQKTNHLGVTREDIEDLASEKSLELLRKLESGRWEMGNRTGAEIAAFLSATARNGIVDFLRSPHHKRCVGGAALDRVMESEKEDRPRRDAADSTLERRAFIEALRDCTEELQPRSRRIWFFRVFYDLATKEIAAHPEINLKPGHVDVVLHTVRQAVRECMEGKEQRLRELPAGTFVEIWKSFRGVRAQAAGTDGQAVDAAF